MMADDYGFLTPSWFRKKLNMPREPKKLTKEGYGNQVAGKEITRDARGSRVNPPSPTGSRLYPANPKSYLSPSEGRTVSTSIMRDRSGGPRFEGRSYGAKDVLNAANPQDRLFLGDFVAGQVMERDRLKANPSAAYGGSIAPVSENFRASGSFGLSPTARPENVTNAQQAFFDRNSGLPSVRVPVTPGADVPFQDSEVQGRDRNGESIVPRVRYPGQQVLNTVGRFLTPENFSIAGRPAPKIGEAITRYGESVEVPNALTGLRIFGRPVSAFQPRSARYEESGQQSAYTPAGGPRTRNELQRLSREGELISTENDTAIRRKITPEGRTNYTLRSSDGGYGTTSFAGVARGGGGVSVSEDDFYDGVDLRGMTPGQKTAAKVAQIEKLTNFMRDTRNQYAGYDIAAKNDQRIAAAEREGAFEEYKKELDSVLQDARERRLTPRATRNAINALGTFYGQKLGLSPQEEEAGKTRRTEIAAEAAIEGDRIRSERTTSNRNRYKFTTDPITGQTYREDSELGTRELFGNEQVEALKAQYQRALDSGDDKEAARLKEELARFFDVRV